MSALDEKIAGFCAEYALSPQQTRIFEALMHGCLSNEAIARACRIPNQRGLHSQLERIARKTMTVSRAELLYLFYEGRRGE
jgi:DNA-binding NarL/FixJ family response regulator